MAHTFIKTHNDASNFVEPTSRYLTQSVGKYTSDNIIAFGTYKRVQRARPGGEWLHITPNVEYRPDLVSFDLWSTCDYWWLLLEYNGMKDILDFKAGRNIRIPSNPLL